MILPEYTILGAGLSGLSASYHLGHNNCKIYEAKPYAGGHAYSHKINGCTWDEGPHISFTQSEYIKDLFEKSVSGSKFFEFETSLTNYYHGNWIPHPAQVNLYAIPNPLRSECIQSFLQSRTGNNSNDSTRIKNYADWLASAFGEVFSKNFSTPYTKKYWTVDPKELSVEWIGNRIHYPNIDSVLSGAQSKPITQSHYFNNARYPHYGGFISFSNELVKNSNIFFNHQVQSIDLSLKRIQFNDGSHVIFKNLINTLPLPKFIELCNPPSQILDFSKNLKCTSLLLVNIVSSHKRLKDANFIYVYDENKLSTRITLIETLSDNNVPLNNGGIQVEVYESDYKPFSMSHSEIADRVCIELIEMGILESIDSLHTQYIPYANVIFDQKCSLYKDNIFKWLENFGLKREPDDLHPLSSWTQEDSQRMFGSIILAGRYGQWKYFWSDDCILRGRQLSSNLR